MKYDHIFWPKVTVGHHDILGMLTQCSPELKTLLTDYPLQMFQGQFLQCFFRQYLFEGGFDDGLVVKTGLEEICKRYRFTGICPVDKTLMFICLTLCVKV